MSIGLPQAQATRAHPFLLLNPLTYLTPNIGPQPHPVSHPYVKALKL